MLVFKWPLNNSDTDSASSYIINTSWNWYLTETILENNKSFEINFDQDLFWLHDSAQQFSIKQDIALNSDLRDKNPFIKLLLICVLLWQWGKNLMKGNLTLPWFYLSKCIQLTETQIVNTELQNMTGLDS